jgi:hypothetical protein
MKTKIVLIHVDHDNARKVCEDIESMVFTHNELLDYFNDNEIVRYQVFDISDFMDGVNDQELDVLTECFMSYVNVI